MSTVRQHIRSFVCRKGRMKSNRQQRFEELWPQYGVCEEGILSWDHLFGRNAENVLEIGFGDGRSLIEMAQQSSHQNFLGVEVYRQGISQLLGSINDLGLTNIRIIQGDAVEVLRQIPNESLTRVQIFFPDPWPKARHHKRRLVQSDFIHQVSLKLKKGGFLHLATDWMDYAYHMMSVLTLAQDLKNVGGKDSFIPRPDYRPLTKYEKRGIRLGHQTWDLLFQRSG